jgi:hypothetical protein
VVSTLLAQVVLTLRSVDLGLGRFHANRGRTKQNLRRHEEESYNRLVPWCDNDVTVCSWHIHNCVYGNAGRKWVCDQAPLAILTYFSISARRILPVPLWVYGLCFFVRHRPLEIGFTAISLIYGEGFPRAFHPERDDDSDYPTDLLAFLLIVHLAVRSEVHRVPIPSLLRTIVRDATYYFLFIFTSHLVLMLFLLFASVSISSSSSLYRSLRPL